MKYAAKPDWFRGSCLRLNFKRRNRIYRRVLSFFKMNSQTHHYIKSETGFDLLSECIDVTRETYFAWKRLK